MFIIEIWTTRSNEDLRSRTSHFTRVLIEFPSAIKRLMINTDVDVSPVIKKMIHHFSTLKFVTGFNFFFYLFDVIWTPGVGSWHLIVFSRKTFNWKKAQIWFLENWFVSSDELFMGAYDTHQKTKPISEQTVSGHVKAWRGCKWHTLDTGSTLTSADAPKPVIQATSHTCLLDNPLLLCFSTQANRKFSQVTLQEAVLLSPVLGRLLQKYLTKNTTAAANTDATGCFPVSTLLFSSVQSYFISKQAIEFSCIFKLLWLDSIFWATTLLHIQCMWPTSSQNYA